MKPLSRITRTYDRPRTELTPAVSCLDKEELTPSSLACPLGWLSLLTFPGLGRNYFPRCSLGWIGGKAAILSDGRVMASSFQWADQRASQPRLTKEAVMRFPRPSTGTILGAIAVFVALGGTAFALSERSAGRWYACVTHAYHTLNLSSGSATCPLGEHKISWDRQASPGKQSPPGHDIIMTLSANKNLSTAGSTNTSILTVQLPESPTRTQYVLAAQGDLVNFGPSDYTRCGIVVNGKQVAAVATMVGSPSASGNRGPASFLSPFSLTGGARVPASGGTATLRCSHDTTNGAIPYADAWTSLWAHQAGGVTTGTE
jgi:hypothetical protein